MRIPSDSLRRSPFLLLLAAFLFPAAVLSQTIPESPSRTVRPSVFPPAEFFPEYDTISLSFIGDVMQHGYQLRSALRKGADPSDGDSYDYSAAFKHVEPLLRRSHLCAANMEFPTGLPPFSGYPLFSAPPAIARQARESGIGLFLLANNHLLDQGEKGLERTLCIYDSLGVPYTGAYRSKEEQEKHSPLILNVRGLKIAFINFTYGTNGFPVPEPYRINAMDTLFVKECIRRAQEKKADLIVALPHWGEEYRLHPSPRQQAWAEWMFRHGIRIILGSHPHVPQTGEIHYKEDRTPFPTDSNGEQTDYREVERIVFYSLGNFISNQSIPDYTQLELLVEIRLIRSNLDGSFRIIRPRWHYLWCFKKGEYGEDYTVVPVSEILGKPGSVRNPEEYRRMEKTYRNILQKNLIREYPPQAGPETEPSKKRENTPQ